MDADAPAEIRELQHQLEAAEREAETLVAGLSEEQGSGRAEAGSWSVAECLAHLATGNRVYLRAMQEPASRARTRGRRRWRPARPEWVGLKSFMASQADVCAFLSANADLDLAGVRFPNPFVRGVYFSLATGLHVIAAHERRHLWQAWRVRRAMERADGRRPDGSG